MSSIANRQPYFDILPYMRRKPQYERMRPRQARMPADVTDVAAKPAAPAVRSIDGVVSSKRLPKQMQAAEVKNPQMVATVTLKSRQSSSGRHFDVVAQPKFTHKQPQATQAISQPTEQPKTNQSQALQQYEFEADSVSKRSAFWRFFPIGVSVAVILIGVGIFALTLRTNKEVIAQVNSGEVQAAVSEEPVPIEEEVSAAAVGGYQTTPGMPKRLDIDSIGVSSRIKKLGTLRSGALASPSNIFDTGWYENSSKPGGGGAMLLVGHVHGPSKPGVFKNLHKLEEGEVISVTRGDNQVFQYKVVKKEQVEADKVDMAAALIPVTPGKSGLNIITCAGELIPGTASYADRIVVYAEQI